MVVGNRVAPKNTFIGVLPLALDGMAKSDQRHFLHLRTNLSNFSERNVHSSYTVARLVMVLAKIF